MKRVKVVTDSSSGLPKELEKQYEITVVPIPIQIGEESYKENVNLPADEFYRLLDGQVMPKTSSPSPGDFVEVYSQLASAASGIISIHVTAKGSGTCQSARVAADSVAERVDVHVYDSNTVSMGTGFLSIEAAKAALEGLTLDQIRDRLDAFRDKIRAFVALPTLKYLQRSGRLSHGQAIFGSLLSIKPVIEIKDGILEVVDKVRSYPRALERVAELAAGAVSKLPARVAVMHGNSYEEAVKFAEQLKERVKISQLIISEVGASLAVHGGPGMIGVVLLPE
ncbi:MAG TPA: DegV family protein [Firmicutes bacterium]|jgi:DegV family protein with EDD domain|nr:DegV family protein [Candidatus Fermentithermobacillaceae bacterium]